MGLSLLESSFAPPPQTFKESVIARDKQRQLLYRPCLPFGPSFYSVVGLFELAFLDLVPLPDGLSVRRLHIRH